MPASFCSTAFRRSARRLVLRAAAVLLGAVMLPAALPAGVVPGAAPAAAQQASPDVIHIPPRQICVLKKEPFQGSVDIPPPAGVHPNADDSEDTATFEFLYFGGWPNEAKAALEYAADIWGDILTSEIPIKVRARWQNIGGATLGFAGPNEFRRASSFPRAPTQNTFYAIPLANAIAGQDLNSFTPEIELTLNSSTNWYFGTDGNVPNNKFSLVSVALHELGHGLGFTGSADVVGSQGRWGRGSTSNPTPISYDRFVVDNTDTLMINETKYPNPSEALGDVLTAGISINLGLFFEGPASSSYKLYTPPTWNGGSSYSHFSYAETGELMRPGTAPGQSIQDPNKAIDVLMDLGWDEALPVELDGFDGVADDGDVVLHWRTLTETNNDHFRLLQKKEGGFVQVGTEPSRVEGGTTNEPQDYSFRVTGLAPGRHTFRLEQVDIDGAEHSGDDTTVEVSLDGAFNLSTAYPNPFRTRTRLDLTVKAAQEVRVSVYDALGRRVAVPFDGALEANDPKAIMLEGDGLSSGLYLVRATGEDFTTTRTITLVQ